MDYNFLLLCVKTSIRILYLKTVYYMSLLLLQCIKTTIDPSYEKKLIISHLNNCFRLTFLFLIYLFLYYILPRPTRRNPRLNTKVIILVILILYCVMEYIRDLAFSFNSKSFIMEKEEKIIVINITKLI